MKPFHIAPSKVSLIGSPMPKFFFDFCDGAASFDEEGIDFASETEAREQALLAAGAIFSDEGNSILSGGSMRFIVRDEMSNVICTFVFTVC